MAIAGSGKGIQIVVGAQYNDKDLKRAQNDLNKLRAQTESTSTGFKRIGTDLKRSMSASTLIASAAVVAFAAKSVQSFAQVQDATDALTATFGATGDSLVNWARTSAISFNLSQREALQAAQTMAVFGDSAGLAGKDLEQFAVSLTERAADAASFFGGSTQDAITAFGSALRGEMEPIRKYGVFLDDATLRAKAFEMGLISTTANALTPQQKTLAAYNVVMEQTTRVQGDVERTSDSMGNQIKKAQAEFDNFQVAIGETLAVALLPLIEKLNAVLGFFNGLPGPIKTASIAIAAIGSVALIIVPKILAVRTAFMQMQATAVTSGKKSQGALLGVGGAAGRAAVGLTALFIAGQTWASTSEDGNAITLEGAYATDEYAQALRDIIQPGVAGAFGNFISGTAAAIIPFNTELADAKNVLGQFDAQLAQLVTSGNPEGAKELYDNLTAGAAAYGASTDDVNKLLPGYTAALEASAVAVTSTADASAAAAPLVDILTAAQRRAKQATAGLSAALDGVGEALARQAALQTYRDAMKEFVSEPTQESAAAVISAMESAAKSFDKPKQQAKFTTDAIGEIEKIAQSGDVKLSKDLLNSLKEADDEARRVIDSINAIPSRKVITIIIRRSGSIPTVPGTTGEPETPAVGGLIGGRRAMGRGSDTVPALLTPGEFVVRRQAVNKLGTHLFSQLNRGINPLAGMGTSSAGGGSGLTINGGITVQSASGERADQSLPRALRRMAFLAGA
jgi:hypothetical protein